MATPTIQSLYAREIFGAHGFLTLQVDLLTESYLFRASVPGLQQIQMGPYANCIKVDGDKGRHCGRGQLKAVEMVAKLISPSFIGKKVTSLSEIDAAMVETLDGSKNEWGWSKAKLGANTTLAVSVAVCKAAATGMLTTVYEYIAQGARMPVERYTMPTPMFTILEGGCASGCCVPCREIMIMPTGAACFREAMDIGLEVYHAMKGIIKKKYGQDACNIGVRGGFAIPADSLWSALDDLMAALKHASHEDKVKIAVDMEASEFFIDGKYDLDFKNPAGSSGGLSASKMCDMYQDLIAKYPVVSITNPFESDDWDAYAKLTAIVGTTTQIVADDLTCSNPNRIAKAIEKSACNAISLKLIECGTVIEAFRVYEKAIKHGLNVIISGCDNETEDTVLVDFGVGLHAAQIRIGAPVRTEHVAEFNQLLRIEEELQSCSNYCGDSYLQSPLKWIYQEVSDSRAAPEAAKYVAKHEEEAAKYAKDMVAAKAANAAEAKAAEEERIAAEKRVEEERLAAKAAEEERIVLEKADQGRRAAEAKAAKEKADRAAAEKATAAESSGGTGQRRERGQKRWGDGLDAPQAGQRDFFPVGWMPQKDWREDIAIFGHSASELDELTSEGDEIAKDYKEVYGSDVRGSYMACVRSYTEENTHNVYGAVNYSMRTASKVAQVKLIKYRDYIYYLKQGVEAFPNYVGVCYRGVDKRFAEHLYAPGSTVTWQAFSSASKNIMQALEFLNKSPDGLSLMGSLFILDAATAKDIELASAVPEEEEVLFKFNSFFRVDGRIVDAADKKAKLLPLSHYDLTALDVYLLRQL